MQARSAAPKPDPKTGEPRPPKAPVAWGWTASKCARDVKPHEPPEGKGPPLEWFAESRGFNVAIVAVSVVLLGLFATWKWGGFGWMRIWYIWVIMIGGSALFMDPRRRQKITAGSDWLRFRDAWIQLYDLRAIRIVDGSKNATITLMDDTYKITIPLADLQKNLKLWDLVYNGVLFSAENGAEVNDGAAEHLHLDVQSRRK